MNTAATLSDQAQLRRACRRAGIAVRIRGNAPARFFIGGIEVKKDTVIPWADWHRHQHTYNRLVEIRQRFGHLGCMKGQI